MKKDFKQKNKNGYTIIETMIAISLFIIIVMAGMGALLNANLVHQKSKNMRSILDNLSFIMEDMSKNLRTGYDYECIDDGGTGGSGPDCWGIEFEQQDGDPANPNDQWGYYIGTLNGTLGIYKSVDGGATLVKLNPDEVAITGVPFSFSVLGAEPPPGDSQQPFVTIKLIGKITYKNIETPFSLQTSVSQRVIDI